MNAKRLMLHCMNVTIRGVHLTQFRRAVHDLGHVLVQDLDPASFVQLSTNLNSGIFADHFLTSNDQVRPRSRLIDLLTEVRPLRVSKDHDRLYVIMHLADDFQEGDITADYAMTPEQVMIDAANHHINLHRDIQFLNDSFQDCSDKIEPYGQDLDYTITTWIPLAWRGYKCSRSGLVPGHQTL